ncbi:endolytic transglycosylase MltG [Candidatus Cytomitobacter primus]|nr:endolytic transglycosylase MltG [Candidatus Cytomitobacter primus]
MHFIKVFALLTVMCVLFQPIHHIIYIKPGASISDRFLVFRRSIQKNQLQNMHDSKSHNMHNEQYKSPSTAPYFTTPLLMLILSSNKVFDLKSGEYNPKNIVQFIYHIIFHKFYMRKITIPEGLSSFQVCQILETTTYFNGTVSKIPDEGTLAPGTYIYARNTNINDMLGKMNRDFIKMTNQIWSKSKQKYWNNKQNWIIFASIVQKEAKNFDEMHMIATIFRNRLDKNMRLDADSTASYAITKGKTHISRVMIKDTKIQSPYNTYVKYKLPIAPITNPGYEALIASINPQPSKKLFFHHRSGTIITSEKFEDHINSINTIKPIINHKVIKKSASNMKLSKPKYQTLITKSYKP